MNSATQRFVRQLRKLSVIACFLLVGVLSARGQKYEITPLVGGMFGGTVKLEQQSVPNFDAHLEDRLSYGIAGGIRFDADDCRDCDSIEFRWMRQNTHLALSQDPIVAPNIAPVFHPEVTLDHFLGDFTHEWHIKESKAILPFLTATLGAVRISTPEAASMRFVFGFATGVNVFPKRHWGFRFQAEYLPIVMQSELQRVVCRVSCIVALDGGILNQFQVSVGPAFRF